MDKIKHFLISALVCSTAFSIARAVGAQRAGSQVAGIVSGATVGILKEVHDKSVGKPFSIGDLVADGAGIAVSAALLNRAR